MAPWDWSWLRNMLRDISFVALILSLIISKQRVTSSVLPLLTEEAPLLGFESSSYAKRLGHFEFKTLLTSSSAFCKRPKFSVPDHPIGCTCGIGTSIFFLGPRNLCILQIFKPPSKRLGSYKFHRSLLSRNSCLVPDSGSTPKWVPPSRLPTGWIMLSGRKGSWATERPSCTCLR